MLPERWHTIDNEDIELLVKIMDPRAEGRISKSKIFTMMALQSTPFPKAKHLETYIMNMNAMADDSENISLRDFVEVNSIFEPF